MLKNALAPRIASHESALPDGTAGFTNRLYELRQLVNGQLKIEQADTYTRFWHGQSTALGLGLMLVPLDGYRSFLLIATLALITIAAVAAALKAPRQLACLAPLFFVSYLFSGKRISASS